MNTLIFNFRHTALLSLLILLPFLASCGGAGNITMVGKAQMLNTCDYENPVNLNVASLPGHNFAYGEWTDDSVVFDGVNDSLKPLWHRATPLGRHNSWAPTLFQSKIGLVAVGPAEWGDSGGVAVKVLDPSTGAILRQSVLLGAAVPDRYDPHMGAFRVRFSSDSSKFMVYRYDYHNAYDKDHNRTISLTGTVYSSALDPLGAGTIDISIPDKIDDDYIKYDAYAGQVALDNSGNFYQFATADPNKVIVKRYDLRQHSSQELETTFDKVDLKDLPEALSFAFPTFDYRGRLVLGMARRVKKYRPDAFLVVCFDFDAQKVAYTGVCEPSKHEIDSAIGESDLDGFIPTHVITLADPPMTVFVAEEDESYTTHMQTISYTVYKLTKTFITGFDTTGHTVFKTGLKKVQETEFGHQYNLTALPNGTDAAHVESLNACLSFAFHPHDSKLGLLYYDGNQDGLFTQDLLLPSGTLQTPEKICNISGGSTLITGNTFWPGDGSAFLAFMRGQHSPTGSIFHVKM